MATIRGTFDLNSRPASSALRKLRTEGKQTDVVMQRVGESMDSIGTTKQREKVRLYREELKRLSKEWTATATKQDAAWRKMEKRTLASVAKQSAEIDSLQGRVNELGRSRPTIAVNVRGVAESIAEVELLQKRLNLLDRSRPTARVGVGGVAASAATSTAARGLGGGSFGSSTGLRSLNLGPFNVGPAGYPAVIGGALAAAPPLLGASTGVLGSASAGLLGAGAVGLGGLGAFSAMLGSIASVAIPAVKGLSEASKALEKYNDAVALNGRRSTEAHDALQKLSVALRGAPSGTSELLNRRTRLSERFGRLTKPAQGSFIGSLSNLLGAGYELTPQLAGIANPLLASGERQSGRLANFLTGPTTRGFLGSAGNTAIDVLPDVESTFQHVLASLMNISRASMPFFKQSIDWLERWTGGWADSTGDIDKMRRKIADMVGHLKSWGRLTRATFDLVKDLFGASAKPGQSLVDDLTAQLEAWDKWVNRNPRQVRQFFRDAVDDTEKIAGALGKIVKMLWRLGRLLTPLLTDLSQFVGFLDSAGLLSPAGLPLLIAGGAGVRRTVQTARGRIAGTGGAASGGLGTGSALVLGGATAASATEAGMARRGGMFRGSMFGGLGKTYGLARGFGYGRAASAAAELGALPGAAAGGGAFARGFASRFLPIAALMGGLQVASYPGDLRERLQSGVSSLSLGLVEPPRPASQVQDEATQRAQAFADQQGERFGSGSLSGLRDQIEAVRRQRRRTLTPKSPGGLTGFVQRPFGAGSVLGYDLGQANTTEVSEDARREAQALKAQLDQLRSARRSLSVERGGGLGSEFQKAFQIRADKQGAEKAFGAVSEPILANIKRLGPAGGRALAQNVVGWAAVAKRQNPKLKKQYQELAEQIEASFARMGRRIRVINGEIYSGSQREWGNIERALRTPIERARQKVEEDFTAIQQQAANSLRAMGFSPAQAKRIIQGMESQNDQRRGAAEAAAKEGPGGYNSKILRDEASGPPTPVGRIPGGARGLRVPGYGNTDHVPLAGLAAPKELIVNNHTEARVNRLLRSFGTSLEGMQRGEKYRQSTPVGQMYERPGEGLGFQRGGRRRGLAGGGIQSVGRWASRMGLSVGEGPGFGGGVPSSGHAPGSFHYSGLAYDVSGAPELMRRFRIAAERRYLGRGLNELFYDPYPYYIDAGKKVQGAIGGHGGHVHIGFDAGGPLGANAIRGLMGGGLGGGFKPVRAGRVGVGGAPGALGQRAMDAYAAGMNRKLREHAGLSARRGQARGGGRVPRGGGVVTQIARGLLRGGLNRIGTAGILGNAYAESSYNPAATGYGGGGLWGFTSSPYSLADLQSFAQSRKRPWTSASLQTQFLLKHVPASLISQLNASPTPEAAAALFMTDWERPGIPRQGVRESAARKAFEKGFARGGRPRGKTLLRQSYFRDLLETSRPSWSDVRLWNRLPDRIRMGRRPARSQQALENSFTDDYKVYDDLSIQRLAGPSIEAGRLEQKPPILASRGARFAWGGWHARGGKGTVDRPTLIGVGERGREDVEIRPHRPKRKQAGGRARRGDGVAVHFHGDVHVRKDSDIDAIADRVGRKLAQALDEDDGIDDEEVIG